MPANFSELVEKYLKETILRPATARSYRCVARQFDRIMKNPSLDTIDRDLLLKWRSHVLKKASAITWNTYFRHWRAIWRWALDQELIRHNPMRGVKWHHPVGQGSPKTIQRNLLSRAIIVLKNEDPLPPGWFWAMVLRVLYYTGIRLHQLVGLEWRDVDLEQQTLLLRSESSKTYREWTIPLHKECVVELIDYRERVCRQLGQTPQGQDQVFNVTLFNHKYAGTRLTEPQVTGFFKRLSKRLDDRVSAHRLRHTIATALANQPQAKLKGVQQMLGHTDLRTTMIYVHPDISIQRAMIDEVPPL